MPSQKDKTLELNQYMTSEKMPEIIYTDIEPLIKKLDGCPNNPKHSSATEIGEHVPCGQSMLEIWTFDHIENKYTLYHGEYCMKKFCTSLRENWKNIIDFKKNKLLPLSKEESKSHQDAKVCYICGKKSLKSSLKAQITGKLKIIAIIQENIEAQHIVFVI